MLSGVKPESRRMVICRVTERAKNGWTSPKPVVVGPVLPDGRIKGTDERFKRRRVNGGLAVGVPGSRVERVDETRLFDPVRKETYSLTRKGTGYYNGQSGRFLQVMAEVVND